MSISSRFRSTLPTTVQAAFSAAVASPFAVPDIASASAVEVANEARAVS